MLLQGYLVGSKAVRPDGLIPWDWLLMEWEDSRQSVNQRVNPWELTDSLLPTRTLEKRSMNKMRKHYVFVHDELSTVETRDSPFNDTFLTRN